MRGVKPHLVVYNGAASVPSKPEQASCGRPAPDWLSEDAKAEWARVMPLLEKRKIITEADLGNLENYCIAIGHVRVAERDIQANGLTIETFRPDRNGNPVSLGHKRNPSVGIQSDAMTRARLLGSELGLTPVSRSRPTVRNDDEGGSSQAFLDF
jgi:P27 family predicted phage terminase small subunit